MGKTHVLKKGEADFRLVLTVADFLFLLAGKYVQIN